jgi:hypothetical protein
MGKEAAIRSMGIIQWICIGVQMSNDDTMALLSKCMKTSSGINANHFCAEISPAVTVLSLFGGTEMVEGGLLWSRGKSDFTSAMSGRY